MVNKQCIAPRGKGVGGTTILSGLRYVRGNKEDFDFWASNGNPRWTYKDVLPYFKKSENATNLEDAEINYHGFTGSMPVEHYKPTTPHLEAVLAANKELGFIERDYNGISQLAIARAHANSRKGRRVTTDTAFMQVARKRGNVRLITGAFVTKLEFKNKSSCVSGVLFTKSKRLFRASARVEVILSAGTISTPQILMLSGIGPKRHLKNLGITVYRDLPVGDNLKDHPTFPMHFNTNLTIAKQHVKSYVKDFLNGLGLYTIAVGTQGLGYYKSRFAPKNSSAPDIEVYYSPPMPAVQAPKGYDGYTNDTNSALNKNFNSSSSLKIIVLNLHPRSSGTVKLQSKSPFDYPLINIRMYSNPIDIAIVYDGIQKMLGLLQTKAMKKINATLGRVELPACANYQYLSRGYWMCTINQLTTIEHHLMGTCKMGDGKKGNVVDSSLRVHGVNNLRVVDASVIMKISGHAAAPAMMIAEKISDEIKRTYLGS